MWNAELAEHADQLVRCAFSEFCVDRRLRLLDGGADEVSPFRPRAVVVLHVLEPEQMLHDEPREARSLADAAVRDDRLVARNALRRIQRGEIVEALERSVLVAVLAPRDALGAGNVPAALAGLRQPGRRENLAGEFLRAADVDERRLLARDR